MASEKSTSFAETITFFSNKLNAVPGPGKQLNTWVRRLSIAENGDRKSTDKQVRVAHMKHLEKKHR